MTMILLFVQMTYTVYMYKLFSSAPVNSLRAVSVSLPASPLFLALSAEENRLCVCVSTGHALKYIFYDLPSLYTTRV